MCKIRITLEAARVNAHMTQTQAGKAIGVSQNTICAWENGKSGIPKAAAIALASVYDMPLECIILPINEPKS